MKFNTSEFKKWLRQRAHFSRAKSIGVSRNVMQQQNIGKARGFEEALEEMEKDKYWNKDEKISIQESNFGDLAN